MTSVLWFQGGACSGNTMSFINAAEPSVVDLIVDFGLEIVYHPTLSMEIGQAAQDIFWSYAILYSQMRIAFSPLRTNEQMVGNSDLSVPQLMSFIVIAISLAAIAYTKLFVKAAPLPAAPEGGAPPASAPVTRRLRS